MQINPPNLPTLDAWIRTNEEVFGFDFHEIPNLQTFLSEIDSKQVNYRCAYAANNGEHDQWIIDVWNCLSKVSKKCSLELLLAEIAPLQDIRLLNGRRMYFVSNIVCGKDVPVEEFDQTILSAYLNGVIDEIARTSNPTETPDMMKVHCLVVTSPDDVDEHAEENAVTSGVRKLVEFDSSKKQKRDLSLNETLNMCKGLFHNFLNSLKQASEEARARCAGCFYMLVPLHRPAIIYDGTQYMESNVGILESGGVVVMILRPMDKVPVTHERIDNLATMARLVLSESITKESARAHDMEMLESAGRQRKLAAYDGIGHSLRAYVEATGYVGAAKELRKALKLNDLPDVARQSMNKALRSLEFFEHAEGLGSLMRLNGWINQRPTNSSEWPLAHKVLDCYYEKTQVEAIREGGDIKQLLTGYVDLVESLANLLATKDDIGFRISTPEFGLEPRDIPAGGTDLSRPLSQMVLPPLNTNGEKAAVIRALSVGFLEPLRNASMYLQDHITDPRFSSPQVEVVIRPADQGACQVFIGNPIFGKNLSLAGKKALSGLNLVSSLLEESHLGHIRLTNEDEDKGLQEAVGCDLQVKYQWVCVEANPLKLFDLAMAVDFRKTRR